MNIFLTGGTGFIGSYIIDELLNNNHNVKILTRQKYSTNKKIQIIKGDITNLDSYESSLSNIDAVFHNAAYTADFGKKKIIYNINVQATKQLAEICIKKNIPRIIYTSSCGVYGFPNTNKIITEDSKKNPINPYQQSKLDAEKLLHSYKEIKTSSVRPPLVLGPGGMGPKIILNRIKNGSLRFIGDGSNTIPLVHPKDVAQCLYRSLEHDKEGTCFNVVSFQCPIKTLIFQLAEKMNVSPPNKKIPYQLAYGLAWINERVSSNPSLTRFRVKTLGTTRNISSEKAKKILGYKPEYNLESTIDEMISWYKSINK